MLSNAKIIEKKNEAMLQTKRIFRMTDEDLDKAFEQKEQNMPTLKGLTSNERRCFLINEMLDKVFPT